MASAAFTELVSRLLEAMGQQLTAVRPTPEGLLLKTGDGFLYAFLEDPTQVSLTSVESLLGQVGNAPMRLAVLTPGHFPLALTQAVVGRRGTVVDGARFAELARSLGLGSYLGGEPPSEPPRGTARLLPSARQLDDIMHRARSWLDWGVPILALRFYRQAATLKPEFAPAKVGVGRALLGLGLVEDADRAFREVLAVSPTDVGARLGEASVFGARGRADEEIRLYRKLLDDEPSHVEVRANLVAALIAESHWSEAKEEVERMLETAPEDPQIRFLHAATLWKTGATADGDREREKARSLGLSFDRESSLCEHLGLPRPDRPTESPVSPPPKATVRSPRPPARRASPRGSQKPKATSMPRRPSRKAK